MIKNFRLSIITTASLLVLSSAGYAQANYKGEDYKGERVQEVAVAAPVCPNVLCLHDGPYIGAGIGYETNRVKVSSTTLTSTNPALSANGWSGSIFAGYGSYFDRFYLAGEILAKFSNADSSYNASLPGVISYDADFRARETYNISILPGVKASESTLLYARLGYSRTSFRANENLSVLGTTVANNSDTRWLNGINYGVGIETAIAENTSIRGEYTYTSYNSFTTNTFDTKFSPSNTSYTLGLIYHFA